MIPRRRATIHSRDLLACLRAARRNQAQDRAVVADFEKRFAAYLGTRHALATASGRDAMVLALQAFGLRAGDEVIVPAYTLGELIPHLQTHGYRPVPIDVEPDTFNLHPRQLAAAIGPYTKAILATHILGSPCEIDAILEIAAKHRLPVLEDCAHSLGATAAGRKTGTLGRAAVFSFEPTKLLPTYGGGMLATSDDSVADRVRLRLDARNRSRLSVTRRIASVWIEEMLLRSFLYAVLQPVMFSQHLANLVERLYRSSHDRLRVQTAYTSCQAEIGIRALTGVEERNSRCNALWQRVASNLPPGFVAQVRDRHGEPAFHNFVARSTRIPPPVLRRRLARAGIDAGIGSEVMDNCAALSGADRCPCAENIVNQGVLLPVYDGLSEQRCARLIAALRTTVDEELVT